MSYRTVFDGKILGTNFRALFNFASNLAAGETISSASTTATVYSGTDASPSSIISGAASISGATVTQVITGGVAGVIYLLTCTATSSASQAMVREAFLVVKDAGT